MRIGLLIFLIFLVLFATIFVCGGLVVNYQHQVEELYRNEQDLTQAKKQLEEAAETIKSLQAEKDLLQQKIDDLQNQLRGMDEANKGLQAEKDLLQQKIDGLQDQLRSVEGEVEQYKNQYHTCTEQVQELEKTKQSTPPTESNTFSNPLKVSPLTGNLNRLLLNLAKLLELPAFDADEFLRLIQLICSGAIMCLMLGALLIIWVLYRRVQQLSCRLNRQSARIIRSGGIDYEGISGIRR